jgi:hypothetical protein
MGGFCMSFAIIRIQKMTAGTVKGIQIHDQREKEYSHTNSDIDFSKSHLNEDLHNSEKVNFNHKVKERIQELTLTRAVRKDAIVMCQCLITSDKPFFDNLSPVEQKKFFDDGFKFIKNRYGEKNMVSATVHYDEKTPHMHVNFVPVTHDGRLCAKDIFKRADLSRLHDDFHKYCKDHGYDLERGESKGQIKKHLSVEEYKLETKKQEIEKNKVVLAKVSNTIKTDLKALEGIRKCVYDIDQVHTKKTFLGSKMAISQDDLKMLMDMAKKGVINTDKIADLESANKDLMNDNSIYRRNSKEHFQVKNELNKEIKDLMGELKIANRQGKAMFKILEKHKLTGEAQKEHEKMVNAEKETKRAINKSKSMGLER